MATIINFSDWFLLKESAGRPGNKSGLYPLGYGGIGLYPPAYWLPSAADAILYVSIDDRLFDNGIKKPWSIEHIPGPTPYKTPNNGEGKPFSIEKIK